MFERKLLAAERQGCRCNLRGISPEGCDHIDKLSCWATLFELVFKAMKYGRRRGLLAGTDPWRDRSWMKKP